MLFHDHKLAGQRLAEKLAAYARKSNVVVLASPQRSLVVASEVAKALEVPLDLLLARQLNLPGYDELVIGAIASHNVRMINYEVVDFLDLSSSVIGHIAAKAQQELWRWNDIYRGNRAMPNLRNQIVILVDDGTTASATFKAAIASIRLEFPAQIVVALPITLLETYREIKARVDQVICVEACNTTTSSGLWYGDLSPMSDPEILALLGSINNLDQTNNHLVCDL